MAYEVDPFPLTGSREKLGGLAAIASLANRLKPSEAQNLAHVLIGIPLLHSAGFQWMQKVVYRWRGYANDDYLNNWLVAHVLSINPELDTVRLVSYNGEIGISVPRRSLIAMEDFQPRQAKLIKAKRLWDPNYSDSDVPTAPTNIDELAARLRTLESVMASSEDARLLLPKTGKVRIGGKPDAKKSLGNKRKSTQAVKSFRVR